MARPKALVFNPGIHLLAGGERYGFAVAEALEDNYDVTIGGIALPSVAELERQGFSAHLPMRAFPFQALPEVSADYDLAVVGVGSLPPYPSRAKRSILAVQTAVPGSVGWRHPRYKWRQRRGLASFDTIVANSAFTQGIIRERWGRSSLVLHPQVELGEYDPAAKEKLIVSVGRFNPDKGQRTLLEAYKRLPADLRSEWRLVLVGSTTEATWCADFVNHLRAEGAPMGVELVVDPPRSEVWAQLRRASMFWHAGAEAFGIVIVEAMSCGAVPIVLDQGAPREIVGSDTGVRWDSIDELVAASIDLASDAEQRLKMAEAAALDARQFGRDAFRERLREIVA